MAPLEDFLLLQRFMRAAFAAQLGRDFPVTKLLQLERETRKYVPQQPTIRWEPVAGDVPKLTSTLEAADPKAAKLFQAWLSDMTKREKTRAPVCDRASS
jgi:hypothetical protein